MLHCNSRAKLYSNCKLCAGRFLVTFSRDEKVMRERLEENSSEQLRLRLAVELNGERKRRTQQISTDSLKGIQNKTGRVLYSTGFIQLSKRLLFLAVVLVRYCQFCTSFCTTSCQYAAAVLCGHSLTETVFVLSLSVRGLECSFHLLIFLYVSVKKVLYAIQLAKLLFFFRLAKFYQRNFNHIRQNSI